MAQTFLSPAQVDELVALHGEGLSVAELARKFGIYSRTAPVIGPPVEYARYREGSGYLGSVALVCVHRDVEVGCAEHGFVSVIDEQSAHPAEVLEAPAEAVTPGELYTITLPAGRLRTNDLTKTSCW